MVSTSGNSGIVHLLYQYLPYNSGMAKSLADIMANKWDEPPEIKVIKNYVQSHFDEDVAVSIGPRQITIEVPGAALAATLRIHIHELQKQLKTDKRLLIRIGR